MGKQFFVRRKFDILEREKCLKMFAHYLSSVPNVLFATQLHICNHLLGDILKRFVFVLSLSPLHATKVMVPSTETRAPNLNKQKRHLFAGCLVLGEGGCLSKLG